MQGFERLQSLRPWLNPDGVDGSTCARNLWNTWLNHGTEQEIGKNRGDDGPSQDTAGEGFERGFHGRRS